ncbi:class I adenylate-forming enzyme family protein [Streptomyces sp. NPDC085927]|uniref:class I adenylate-forming enzyme family protein n=1 Tax=Streptomyces sp. NPDC085927 TaxID=3365738 RepID=UPI0037D2A020
MTTSIDSRRQALREQFPVWIPRTLDAWLDVCAERYGDRPFVITDDVTLTYREVAEQSRRLADGLVTLGVGPGQRVGMLMANHPEFVPLKFAIARTGATAIPFNYLYREDELGYVLAQSQCSTLITMTGFAGLDYLSMLDSIAPGWETPDRADAEGSGPKDLRHVIVFPNDGRTREKALDLDGLAALGDRNPGAAANMPHTPDDIGDMLYTSGSTGSPKGVQVRHDAVLRTAYASALTRAYEDGRRILFSLPCYHMFGYVEGLLSVMYVGGAIVPQTSFSAENYFAGIQRHRATDILCVPTMAVAMVQTTARDRYDLSSLTAVLCGSAPAPIWLWETFEKDLGVSEIVTGYGMTECGGAMTLTFPEDPLELTSTTVGRPKIAGSAGVEGGDDLVRYRTVDPQTGEPLPAGGTGELTSQGPTVMAGFYGKPEETALALRDGWLHSGDLGRVREDGYLEITGRSKELYKSGGELVMPKEIEDLLAARDDVSQVFAIGLNDDRWGEIGCAVIVPTAGARLTEEDVIAYCKEHLARFKVPKRVLFLDAEDLPKTPTGKVQKFRLVEQATAAWKGTQR